MRIGLLLSFYPDMEGWNDFVPLGLGYLAAHGRKHFPNTEYLIHHSAEKIIELLVVLVSACVALSAA